VSVLVGLIAAGGAVAAGFLIAFVWAVRAGQFDDTVSPALRILFDDVVPGSSPARPSPTRSIPSQSSQARFESAADVQHRS
jgi:cbb3-type cytochrome oxidase maturation protein